MTHCIKRTKRDVIFLVMPSVCLNNTRKHTHTWTRLGIHFGTATASNIIKNRHRRENFLLSNHLLLVSIKWKSKFNRQKSNFKTNSSQQEVEEGQEECVRPHVHMVARCPLGGDLALIFRMTKWHGHRPHRPFPSFNENNRFACVCGPGCRCLPRRVCRAKIICRMLFVEFRMRQCERYTQPAPLVHI